MRGLLNGIFQSELLKQKKELIIQLLEAQVVNYDLLDSNDSYRNLMKKTLIELEHKYKLESDRECIYFICVKPKITINLKKSKKNIITFNIHKDKKINNIKLNVLEILNKIEFSSTAAILYSFDEDSFTIQSNDQLYTFLITDIRDYIFSSSNFVYINYIGETKEPSKRPFNNPHKGMMKTIHEYSKQNMEIFIYYNFFHITAIPIEEHQINIIYSNSMLEMFNKKDEGKFIQNLLIKYFLPSDYSVNYPTEIGELKNQIKLLKEDYNVEKINVNLDYTNGLDQFYSKIIVPKSNHNFKINTKTSEIEV